MRQPSREQLLALVLASVMCLVTISAVPLPSPAGNQELDVLQIPLANGKEIDVLTLGAKDQEQMIADRNKRTIGLLRELFPDITKEIDSIVNRIIAQVIRVAGPGLLNSVLAGNRGGAAAGGAGGRATTPSSSFDADFDADFDDDDDDSGSSGSASSSPSPSAPATRSAVSSKANEVDESTRIKIDLPTFAPKTSEAGNQGDSSSENQPSLPTTTPETTTSSTSSSNPTSTTSNPTLSTTTTTTTSPVEALFELIPRSLEPSTTSASASATTPSTAISTTTDTDSVTDLSQPPRDSTIQNPTNSIDEPLLLNIIADINRLLNSTNYFITTRDNLTATESSTSTEVPTIDNNLITKLLPVFD
ncbi:hypothetical protein KR026_000374 [Drosophila bipectinata]|nr:hypothetical protein KR026_000374 [Drosophila bipectinata]